MTVSDWTERYRPDSERQLEGNERQRKLIRNWLQNWTEGVPKNQEFYLSGHLVLVKLLLLVQLLMI